MSEVITSLEMNFVNNGGGHTASVNSVLGAKTPNGASDLGTLNGTLGDRYDFSNEEISRLMKQFIAVEETTAEDSNNAIRKSVKFKDRVSLIMDAHVFLLRGVLTSPFDSGLPFEGPIFKHSEHPFSSIPAALSSGPIKQGGVITIGKTYSVVSTNFEGEPYSLGYHNKELEDGLVYNRETADRDSESTNLSNYNLLYGYKISEFKEALDLLGLKIKDLPESETIFNYTGKVSAVISSIASSLGYYWYVNPFNGEINFINSIEAIQKTIENPLKDLSIEEREKIQNVSFTESKIKKAVVNSFVGNFENFKRDGGDYNRERKTNFYRIKFAKDGSNKLLRESFVEIAEYFYALWASGNLNGFKFDALFFYIIFLYSDNVDLADAVLDEDEDTITPLDNTALIWPQGLNIVADSEEEKQSKNSDKKFGNRAAATWFNIKSKATIEGKDRAGNNIVVGQQMIDPSKLKISELLTAYYETMHKSFFVSPTYSFKQAERRAFEPKNLEIYGPFKKQTPLVEIEELSFLRPLLEYFKTESITLEDLLMENDLQKNEDDNSGIEDDSFRLGFTKDYVFIGLRNKKKIDINFQEGNNKILKFDFLNEENVEMFFEPANRRESYIGFKDKVIDEMPKALELSKDLFNKNVDASSVIEEDPDPEASNEGSVEKPEEVIRVAYRIKSRAEIDAEAGGGEEEEEEEEDKATNTDSGEDVSNDFEQKYFNVINNGADGEPWHPADVVSKQGLIGEIKAAEANAYKAGEIPQKTLKSSSRTIYGLIIPKEEEYDITISSISFSLAGGQGITTTISESTIDLIPVDEQFIVSDFYNKATNMRSTSPRTTASQRNFLGL